jgi:hypothetical protein
MCLHALKSLLPVTYQYPAFLIRHATHLCIEISYFEFPAPWGWWSLHPEALEHLEYLRVTIVHIIDEGTPWSQVVK